MNPDLLDRLAVLITKDTDFTADDVTLNGSITAAGDHDPNAKQNSIGSLFRTASANRWITATGDTKQSTAPHRKGGLIRVWHGTAHGRVWAAERPVR